jgi:Tfp pilus assembly protein FimT
MTANVDRRLGSSLLELLITLAIIALLLGCSCPRLGASIGRLSS